MAIKPVSGEVKSQDINDNLSYLDSKLDQVNGGPLGSLGSVAELNQKYPNGANGFFIIDGHMYFWENNKWVDKGVYQAKDVPDHSLTGLKIKGHSVPLTKIIGSKTGKNLWSGEIYEGIAVVGGTNKGSIVENASGICIIEKIKSNSTYTITKKDTDRFRVGITLKEPQIGDNVNTYILIDEQDPMRETFAFHTGPNDTHVIIYVSASKQIPSVFQLEEGGESTDYEMPGGRLPLSMTTEQVPKERVGFSFQEMKQSYLYAGKDAFVVDLIKQEIRTYRNGSNVILVDKKNSSFDDSVLDYSKVDSNTVFILFDDINKKFVLSKHNELSDDENDKLSFVGMVRKNTDQVHINGFYTLIDKESKQDSLFVTNIPNNYYKPEHDDVTTAITDSFDSEIIFDAYNDLVSKDDSYIKKRNWGLSAGGIQNYYYEMKPAQVVSYVSSKRFIPKIILTGTMHGHEKHASRGLLIFIRNLVLNWKNNPELEFIRANFHIILAPIINPDGYNKPSGNTPDGSGPAGRKNGNEVDLNRNFGPDWGINGSSDVDNWMYQGPSEMSEPESKMLAKLLDDHPDALHFIDFHNYGNLNSFKDCCYVSTDNSDNQKLWLAFGQTYDSNLRKKYPKLDVHKNDGLVAVRPHVKNTWQLYAESKGFNSILLESIESAANVTDSEMYLINADNIGNVILEICKNINLF